MSGFLAGILTATFMFCLKECWRSYINKRRLAGALLAEIRAVVSQYEKMGGATLFDIDNKKGLYTMKISEDFFMVYNANTNCLGLFDIEVAGDLIKLYTNFKGFVCTVRTWDFMLEKLSNNLGGHKAEIEEYSKNAKIHYSMVKEDSNPVIKYLTEIVYEGKVSGFWNYMKGLF